MNFKFRKCTVVFGKTVIRNLYSLITYETQQTDMYIR